MCMMSPWELFERWGSNGFGGGAGHEFKRAGTNQWVLLKAGTYRGDGELQGKKIFPLSSDGTLLSVPAGNSFSVQPIVTDFYKEESQEKYWKTQVEFAEEMILKPLYQRDESF